MATHSFASPRAAVHVQAPQLLMHFISPRPSRRTSSRARASPSLGRRTTSSRASRIGWVRTRRADQRDLDCATRCLLLGCPFPRPSWTWTPTRARGWGLRLPERRARMCSRAANLSFLDTMDTPACCNCTVVPLHPVTGKSLGAGGEDNYNRCVCISGHVLYHILSFVLVFLAYSRNPCDILQHLSGSRPTPGPVCIFHGVRLF